MSGYEQGKGSRGGDKGSRDHGGTRTPGKRTLTGSIQRKAASPAAPPVQASKAKTDDAKCEDSEAMQLIARIEEIDETLSTGGFSEDDEAALLAEQDALKVRLEQVTGVTEAVKAEEKRAKRDERNRAAREKAAPLWKEVSEPEDYDIYEWFFEGYKRGLTDDQIAEKMITAMVEIYEETLREQDAAGIAADKERDIYWSGPYTPLFGPGGDGPGKVQFMRHQLQTMWTFGGSPLIRLRCMIRIWANDTEKGELIVMAYMAEFGGFAFRGGGGGRTGGGKSAPRGTNPKAAGSTPPAAKPASAVETPPATRAGATGTPVESPTAPTGAKGASVPDPEIAPKATSGEQPVRSSSTNKSVAERTVEIVKQHKGSIRSSIAELNKQGFHQAEMVEALTKAYESTGRNVGNVIDLADGTKVLTSVVPGPNRPVNLVRPNGMAEFGVADLEIRMDTKAPLQARNVRTEAGELLGDAVPPTPDAGTKATRARRIEELAMDPDKRGKVTDSSRREAEVALALEEQGRLRAPIRRPKPGDGTSGDFVDGENGQWDVKRPRSRAKLIEEMEANERRKGKEPRPSDPSQPKRGEYDQSKLLKDIRDEIGTGERVIIDTESLTPEDLAGLKKAVADSGLADKVIFFP